MICAGARLRAANPLPVHVLEPSARRGAGPAPDVGRGRAQIGLGIVRSGLRALLQHFTVQVEQTVQKLLQPGGLPDAPGNRRVARIVALHLPQHPFGGERRAERAGAQVVPAQSVEPIARHHRAEAAVVAENHRRPHGERFQGARALAKIRS